MSRDDKAGLKVIAAFCFVSVFLVSLALVATYIETRYILCQY